MGQITRYEQAGPKDLALPNETSEHRENIVKGGRDQLALTPTPCFAYRIGWLNAAARPGCS
jgi:hypothetical protein